MNASPKAFYRARLYEELEKRALKNPRYSQRALAKSVGVEAGAFSQIVSGKRIPSAKTAEKIARALSLSPEETRRFIASLAAVQRSRGLERLSPLFRDLPAPTAPQKELSSELFRVIADWYHYALLELTNVKGFSADPSWIATRLGITRLEAKLALKRLLDLELLEEKDGKLTKTQLKFTTADKSLTSAAHRRRQKQVLEKAIESLENDPIEIRSMTSVTMAIDPKKVSEAKKIILEFNQKLADFLTEGDQTQVYELGVCLYPVQKRRN